MSNQVRIYHRWTEAERELLDQLIEAHTQGGHTNWKEVAAKIGTKTARQCYDQHAGAVKRHQEREKKHYWTQDEEKLLIKVFPDYEFKWDDLKIKYFPNLSVQQLKNKVNTMKQKDKNVFANSKTQSQSKSHYMQNQSHSPSERASDASPIVQVDQLIQQLKSLLAF